MTFWTAKTEATRIALVNASLAIGAGVCADRGRDPVGPEAPST